MTDNVVPAQGQDDPVACIRFDKTADPNEMPKVERLVLPKLFGVCQCCVDNGNYEIVGERLEDLRWDGKMWSCEKCWNPDEIDQWATAPQAATALTAQQAEIKRLRAERDAWKENADALRKQLLSWCGDESDYQDDNAVLAAHAKLKREL